MTDDEKRSTDSPQQTKQYAAYSKKSSHNLEKKANQKDRQRRGEGMYSNIEARNKVDAFINVALDHVAFLAANTLTSVACVGMVLMFLAFLSFPLDPVFGWNKFSSVFKVLRLLRVFALADDVPISTVATQGWVMVTYFGFITLSTCFLATNQRVRLILNSKIVTLMRSVTQFSYRALSLPLFHFSFKLLFSSQTWTNSSYIILNVLIILSFSYVFVTIIPTHFNSHAVVHNSSDPLNSFIPVFLITEYLSLIIVSFEYNFLLSMTVNHISITTATIVFSVSILLLSIFHIALILFSFPFQQRFTNFYYTISHGIFAVSSITLLFQSIFNAQDSVVPFIILCATIVVVSLGLFFLTRFVYIRKVSPMVDYISVFLHEQTINEQPTHFYPKMNWVEFQIFTQHAFWAVKKQFPHMSNEDLLERMLPLLKYLVNNSTTVRMTCIIFAHFLLSHLEEKKASMKYIKRGIKKNPSIIIRFFHVSYIQKRRFLLRAIVKEGEEIDNCLCTLNELQNDCYEFQLRFWKATASGELNNAFRNADEMDKSINKVIQMYMTITYQYPNSVKVLRHFANFALEILQDSAMAIELRNNADFVEETQKKRRQTSKSKALNNVLETNETGNDKDEKKKFYQTQLQRIEPLNFVRFQWYSLILLVLMVIIVGGCVVCSVVFVNTGNNHLSALFSSMQMDVRVGLSTSFTSELALLFSPFGTSVSTRPYLISYGRAYLAQIVASAKEILAKCYINTTRGETINPHEWLGVTNNETTLLDSFEGFLREIGRVGSTKNSDFSFSAANELFVQSNALHESIDRLLEIQRSSFGSFLRNYRIVYFYIFLTLGTLWLLGTIFVAVKTVGDIKARIHSLYCAILRIPQNALNQTYISVGGSEKEGKRLTKRITDSEITENNVTIRSILLVRIGMVLSVLTIISTCVIVIARVYRIFSANIYLETVRVDSLTFFHTQHVSAQSSLFVMKINSENFETLKAELTKELTEYSKSIEALALLETLHVSCEDGAQLTIPLFLPPCDDIVEMIQLYVATLIGLLNTDYNSFNLSNWEKAIRINHELILPFAFKVFENRAVFVSNDILFLYFIIAVGVILFIRVYSKLWSLSSVFKRIITLLLRLPPEVIESSDEIKLILMTGSATNNKGENNNIDLLIEKTLTRTEKIIQAAADAVVIFNVNTLRIETFNLSAIKLFGFLNTDNIIGKNLAELLPKNVIEVICKLKNRLMDNTKKDALRTIVDGKKNDRIYRFIDTEDDSNCEKTKKDKEIELNEKRIIEEELCRESVDAQITRGKKSIPTNISVSFSGSVGAIFLRDLRNLKGYQKMIEMNEELLHKIFPKSIAAQLKDDVMKNEAICIAQKYNEVSILFADMVKFTNWSANLEPDELVSILNRLVCLWDEIATSCGVEKIKTIGDCYMAVCGCPDSNEDNARTLVDFGTQMIAALREYNATKKTQIQIRVGIHTGSVVAGVIGYSKIIFDVWGPSVSIAAAMEAKGIPMAVSVSQMTYEKTKNFFSFEPKGEVSLKDGSNMMSYVYSPPNKNDNAYSHLLNDNTISRTLSQSIIYNDLK